MKSSWKTSLFGQMAAIGGTITAAMATGIVDPNHFPLWFKDIVVLCSLIGTSGLGNFARDNNRSSEQVGAGGKPKEDKRQTKLKM